ncbi:hypothetical protein J6524_16900 [Bradyrhizobium sp. WSM 1738]|uniref:hypothetical protein n=1 Tax=Bradyrhizobium hereditatis TaxID=2821405 RepID=UPI001CE2B18B|nr:hypothetical protein [Bradyrhizobium hereditatis]MCA6116563.1 hypothetical protein [Bradyrhizobium hereditatis]
MQPSDPEQKMRMDILHRDAERKILEKLRTHNWSAVIEREFPDGLLIAAERGGHRHTIALIYSSDTENSVYNLSRPSLTISCSTASLTISDSSVETVCLRLRQATR